MGNRASSPLPFQRQALVKFTFDGTELRAPQGTSVAAALLDSGTVWLRNSPELKTPRGAFCWMGLCQECLVEIDGIRVESCRTVVSADMDIRSIP